MPRMKILSPAEEDAFESPPLFSLVVRSRYFDFPQSAYDRVDTLRTPTNAVCFLVMLGYFKAVNRFFTKKFHAKDIEYVAERLQIPISRIDIDAYDKQTYLRHRKMVLEYCGFDEFDGRARRIIAEEIKTMVRSQLRPKLIFIEVLEILKRKRIEIPIYNILANLIVDEINNHRRELSRSIERLLSDNYRHMLDSLLEKKDDESEDSKVLRYKLTLLKRINQSLKPKKIKESIQDFITLRELFQPLEGVVDSLDLTQEGIKYYASSVIKSEIFQVARRSDEDKYLHLITFTIHQYFRLHDTLIDVLLASVQNAVNNAKREHKEEYYREREQRNQSIITVINYLDNHNDTINIITTIATAPGMSDSNKIERIIAALSQREALCKRINEQLSRLKAESHSIVKDSDFYEFLERKSIKLQNRVSEIIKNVDFREDAPCQDLMKALVYYRMKGGAIDKNAPVDFLDNEERELLFGGNGKLRVSLYKVLFFIKIADAIKAGTLNLRHSFKYRSIEDYLIPKDRWEKHKYEYLKRADLEKFADCKTALSALEGILDSQYHTTNKSIIEGKNQYVAFRKDGLFQLHTPGVGRESSVPVIDFFPSVRYISLLEILSTVNNASHFLDKFRHWQMKYNRTPPPEQIFWAGIIGYGCNIGTRKIAKISRQINESELENTINWYFSIEAIDEANDRIIKTMDQLELPNIYRKDKDILYISSDGQKFNVAVDSLNANYSFKYFGKGKGVTVYSFIDERNFLFHSTVISASEREAAYVIDGLMHNNVVKSDIHSTDTHGYSNILSGSTYLLGFSFAPRIRNLKDLELYSFQRRRIYTQEGYRILPEKYIDTALIEDNWDDILRFIATIKLRETTASQLFKRLNSYSKRHPLYEALKEFGKITRTIFVLRYIDDVELRQAIMRILNKMENAHKFEKVIAFGNSQEFLQGTKEEQDIIQGCRRLIENAIICWNYLYLSQKIVDEQDKKRRQESVETIKNGSVVLWQHVNLHGEYDFSEEKLRDSIGLRIPEIMELKVP